MYVRCNVFYCYILLLTEKSELGRDKFAIAVYTKYFYEAVGLGFNSRELCLEGINKVVFFTKIKDLSLSSVFAH